MKKLLTFGSAICLAAAATMMVASCSNEITETSETVKTKTNVPVKVKLYAGQSSRAAETTIADIVNGLELVVYKKAKDGTLTNLNVSHDIDAQGNINLYTTEGTNKYLLSWPTDGSSLAIVAQYGATADYFSTSGQGAARAPFISNDMKLTLSSASSQADVVAGYTESTLAASTNGVVSLTLSHIFTELNLTLKAPDENITYSVQSIEMSTKAIGATYDITKNEWTPNPAGADAQIVEILSGNATPINLTAAGVNVNNTVFVYPDNAQNDGAKLSITYSAKRNDIPVDFGNGNLTNNVEVALSLVKGEKQRYTITLPATSVASAKVIVDAWPTEKNTDKDLNVAPAQ